LKTLDSEKEKKGNARQSLCFTGGSRRRYASRPRLDAALQIPVPADEGGFPIAHPQGARCFRLLVPADPIAVRLRGWSRIAEDLGVERGRLANRLRQQLWRYFPALSNSRTTSAPNGSFELWQAAPMSKH